MKIRAAVFDVDGTLVRSNVTYLFMRYLMDNRIVEPAGFRDFSIRYIHAQPDEYPEVITESLHLLSYSNFQQLQPHWNRCFASSVKPAFNHLIIEQIKELQKQQAEIILASGSYLGLITRIAEELGIPHANILATSSPELICYGETKRNEVLNLLNRKKIPLAETVFYSDNISDVTLLTQTGQGYWTGKEQLFIDLGLSKLGIKTFESVLDLKVKLNYESTYYPDNGLMVESEDKPKVEPTNDLNNELLEYYNQHLPLFERSMKAILPDHCTAESMEYLVGPVELSWDLQTLEQSFFKPAHSYLNKKPIKWHCLGTCLFMEAGGLKPAEYLPLIAITELLDTSARMFSDIREWAREENFAAWHTSRMENAIIGNVSIALISMVTHNLIFNRLSIDAPQKLVLYESLTTAIFNSLFGNGLKLYREEQPVTSLTEDEYYRMAELLNSGIFRFYFDLWNILAPKDISKRENTFNGNALRESFLKNLSIAIQLKSDKGTALLESVQWNDDRNINHSREALKALEAMSLDTQLTMLLSQYINHFVL